MTEVSRAPTEEDVAAAKADFETRVEAAMDLGLEATRPRRDWYLAAIGPYGWAYGSPTDVIRVGEYFYVIVWVWFNPWPSDPQRPSACELVTSMACTVDIEICTMDVCNVRRGPADLNTTRQIQLVRGQCWYYEVFSFYAQPGWEGLFDMNITARVTGCQNKITPYAGFADNVTDIVPDSFDNPSGMPTKFLITSA
jgi:hypothetical protein